MVKLNWPNLLFFVSFIATLSVVWAETESNVRNNDLDTSYMSKLRFQLRRLPKLNQCAQYWYFIDAKLKGLELENETPKVSDDVLLQKFDINLLVKVRNHCKNRKATYGNNDLVNYIDSCINVLSEHRKKVSGIEEVKSAQEESRKDNLVERHLLDEAKRREKLLEEQLTELTEQLRQVKACPEQQVAEVDSKSDPGLSKLELLQNEVEERYSVASSTKQADLEVSLDRCRAQVKELEENGVNLGQKLEEKSQELAKWKLAYTDMRNERDVSWQMQRKLKARLEELSPKGPNGQVFFPFFNGFGNG